MNAHPVPRVSTGSAVPALLFCHSIELSRLLEAGEARKVMPFGFRVCLERSAMMHVGGSPAPQPVTLDRWVELRVDDAMPQTGLWDVVGYFLEHGKPPVTNEPL